MQKGKKKNTGGKKKREDGGRSEASLQIGKEIHSPVGTKKKKVSKGEGRKERGSLSGGTEKVSSKDLVGS